MIRQRLVYHKAQLAPVDWKFYLSLTVGATFTFWLYAFLVGVRELSRTTIMEYFHWYQEISAGRLYVFNIYIAFISSTAGFALFGNMWMSANMLISERIRATVSLDQKFVPGIFFYLFVKLGFTYALFWYASGVSAYVDLLAELWPFFIVSMIVMSLHQWQTLRWHVRQASARVMAYAAAGQLLFSIIIAAIPIYDTEGLGQMARKYNPEYVLEMNIPKSRIGLLSLRRSLTEPMHVGYKKGTKELLVSVGTFNSTFIPIESIPDKIAEVRDRLMESEREYLQMEFYAGSDIPAKVVIGILDTMRKEAPIWVSFMTNSVKGQRGVPMELAANCARTQYCGELIDWLKGASIIKIQLKQNKLFVGDSSITKKQFYDWSRQRLNDIHDKKEKPTILYLKVDDESTFASYVSLLEENYAALIDLRRDKVKSKFKSSYDFEDRYNNESEVENYAQEFRGVYVETLTEEEEQALESELNRDPDH